MREEQRERQWQIVVEKRRQAELHSPSLCLSLFPTHTPSLPEKEISYAARVYFFPKKRECIKHKREREKERLLTSTSESVLPLPTPLPTSQSATTQKKRREEAE